MPADEFVAMASDPKVLGDKTLMTQHFQGASKWEKVSDDEIIGYHQLRVPHQKYTDETRTAVAVKGHAHSSNTHWVRKDPRMSCPLVLYLNLAGQAFHPFELQERLTEFQYKKIDGVWKFAGLNPDIRWAEYDFDKVFESGREELGDKEKEEEAHKLAAQAEGIPVKK